MYDPLTDYCICRNPFYPLYAKKVEKGLSVNRVADDARIATIIVRDISQVVNYQWDVISGKFLIIFYKDGTARTYDGFKAGKLLSLLRITNKKVDGGIWDRIEEATSPSGKMQKFDHDVSKLMPKMIKFARDSRQIYILPYDPPNSEWRQTVIEEYGNRYNKKLLDIHIVHQEGDDELVVMLNGDYVLSIKTQNEGLERSSLREILVAEHGLYHCFYEDGSATTLSLRPLLECQLTSALLKHVVTMRQLYGYLYDHLDLIKKDLVAPYTEFMNKVCGNTFGFQRLNEELTSLLLVGSVSEQLEDWLCNTIGEKNFKKWKKLELEGYQKSIQILTLSFIPACERLIILTERFRGMLKALQLREDQKVVKLVEIADFIRILQSCLKLILEAIQRISSQERLSQIFFEWFNDKVHESLDEDYKPKVRLESDSTIGHDLALYIKLQFKEKSQSKLLDEFIKVETIDNVLREITHNLEVVANLYVLPRVLQKIHVEYRHKILNENNEQKCELLDIAHAPLHSHILYVLASTIDESTTYSIGTLDTHTLTKVSQEVPLILPQYLKTQSIENARIGRLLETDNDNYSHDNVTNTFPLLLIVNPNKGHVNDPQDAHNLQSPFSIDCHCQITPNGKNIAVQFTAQETNT